MKRIALISDTHGFLDPSVLKHAADCDEIWHAGDIGTSLLADELEKMKTLRAVYGNIDGQELRIRFPEVNVFDCEGLKVLILHIGGYPGAYSPQAGKEIEKHRPGLFISGHSHILKVMPDKKRGLLHMNPGAAGNQGFHPLRTMLRFTVSEGKVKELQAIELGKRG